MDKEEKYIFDRVGKENPFKVPDSYFDTLQSKIMAGIDSLESAEEKPEAGGVDMPEAKVVEMPKTKSKFYRYLVAASLALTLAAGASFWFHSVKQQQDAETLAEGTVVTDSFIDAAADYAMLDDIDMYACIADNE